MTNKPITPEEMKAYVDATWEKCQAEAWQEPVCGHGVRITKCPFCQPLEQKPVAWRHRGNLHEFDPSDWAEGPVTPLYTTPPRREWQGLTDKELAEFSDLKLGAYDLCLEVEAKLREKNHA